MRQTITPRERDYCQLCNDEYAGIIFEKYSDKKGFPDVRYKRLVGKLTEWEIELNRILVSEVSDHK